MKVAWWRSAMVAWHGVVALVTLAGVVAQGQTIENLALARTFGAGVHAYFCGDYDRSYDELTAAIEAGSEDPRTRYFRGLAALRLGRLDEAEADFSEGADLESRAIGSWPVSRSLERVQGHDRVQLERHRVRARVAALQREQAAERERYITSEAAQPEVLRRRRPAALPGPATDAANPFADPAGPDQQRERQLDLPAPESPAEIVPPATEPQAPEPAVPVEAPEQPAEPPAPQEPEDPFDVAEPPAQPEAPAEPADPFDPGAGGQ